MSETFSGRERGVEQDVPKIKRAIFTPVLSPLKVDAQGGHNGALLGELMVKWCNKEEDGSIVLTSKDKEYIRGLRDARCSGAGQLFDLLDKVGIYGKVVVTFVEEAR